MVMQFTTAATHPSEIWHQVNLCAYAGLCWAGRITDMSGDIPPWLLRCLCVLAVHWLICMVTLFQGCGWAQWLSLAVTSHHLPVIETAEQRAVYEQWGDWRKSCCWMTHTCIQRSVPRYNPCCLQLGSPALSHKKNNTAAHTSPASSTPHPSTSEQTLKGMVQRMHDYWNIYI